MITIYHNPHCSKSREALALVQQFSAQNKIPLTIIDYLHTPPTLEQLHTLHQQLGKDVRHMVRDTEEEFTTLELAHASDLALLQAVAGHPKLLQRPIVIYRERAMIGRPPAVLHALLQPI